MTGGREGVIAFGSPGKNRLFISLGLHSAALIAFQLVLMQLLSMVQWHHFAFMVIAIAMLGFGASGTFIALFRVRLLAGFSWLYPLLMVVSGLLMSLVFPLSRISGLEFDLLKLFADYDQFWALAANYLLFFLPFFLGAISIGMAFIQLPEAIGKCYFSNLAGSGLGGLFVLALAGWYFPEQIVSFAALASILAGLISFPSRKKGLLLFVSIPAAAVAVTFLISPFSLNPSQYKAISKTMNLPAAKIEYREPDTHGVLEIASSPAMRYAPSVSLGYTGEIPVKKSVFLNGDFYGVIPHKLTDKPHIHSYTTMSLPYIMGHREHVLILNAGTGSGIAHALSQNAGNVDASIGNPGIIRLMQERYAEESGHLFQHENVTTAYADPRIFLSGVKSASYDLIEMPVMEAFGGTSGLNSLQENYGLTLEAFSLMWDALTPDGVISVTSWMDYPARTSLKIAATLAETARIKGIHSPIDHLVAIRSWGTITFGLKKTPVTAGEVEEIKAFCKEMFFDPALWKHLNPEKREVFNRLEDPSFFHYLDQIVHEETPDVYEDYGFTIRPSTDDKPYFSQFLRFETIRHILSLYNTRQLPYLELGYFTVIATLIQSILFAFVLIVLPLYRLRSGEQKKGRIFLFFAAIGVGYMFTEIIMIQAFVLYFGYPLVAIAAVISVMLIASGVGSLYSGKILRPGKSVSIVAFIILSLLALYAVFLTPLLQESLGYARPLKFMFALLLIAVPAFFMGMPFPLAIRVLSDNRSTLIPWAWGINGCFSVISSVLAMLLALTTGFTSVMTGAVICYFLAALAFYRKLP